jgi:hypothetical protein
MSKLKKTEVKNMSKTETTENKIKSGFDFVEKIYEPLKSIGIIPIVNYSADLKNSSFQINFEVNHDCFIYTPEGFTVWNDRNDVTLPFIAEESHRGETESGIRFVRFHCCCGAEVYVLQDIIENVLRVSIRKEKLGS